MKLHETDFSVMYRNALPSVVFCYGSFLPVIGGIEIWISKLAERLKGKCNVYVLTKQQNRSWPKREVLSGINVIRYWINLPKFVPRPIFITLETLLIFKEVLAIIRKNKHIIFNFFDPLISQVLAAGLIRSILSQPVACTLGGTVSEFSSRKVKILAAKLSNLIMSISGYALRAFGVPHSNTQIYYPIGELPADFNKYTANFENHQILVVCRVHPRKNLEDLILIAQQLPKLSFVVAGDYTLHQDYYRSLVTTMDKFHVQNVYFLGQVDHEHYLQDLYRQSTLLFLPSKHEMFGLVFAEAMSYGLPIVAPRHTAIPEAVGEGTGILYEPGDLDACCHAIDTIAGSYTLWKQFSINAKAFMEKQYTQDYIGKYVRLLLSIGYSN